MRKVLVVTAAVLAAVIFFLLVTLPSSAGAVQWDGDAGLARRTVAGAYHIHTTRSDGSADRAAVAAAAARAGLAFIVITDHGDGMRAPAPPEYLSGVLCLDGVEISTNGGHYAAIGMRAAPYPLGGEPASVVEDVARLGGFGIAAHPDSPRPELAWTDWSDPIDGIEWLSADTEWRDEGRARLARVFFDYLLKPAPALASMLDRPVTTIARWDAMTARRPIVAIAGHDAHGGIGRADGAGRRTAWGRVPSYEASFRSFSTRAVLSAPFGGDAVVDARRLLEAIRSGALFTAVDAVAAPAVLDFQATRGGERLEMGARSAPGPAVLSAQASVPAGSRIALLRNGVRVAGAAGGSVELNEASAEGAYRVEVDVPGAPGNPPVPWLFSNPIYFLNAVPATAVPLPAVSSVPLGAETAWHVEHDPASSATLAADTDAIVFEYHLGAGARTSQFAALAADLRSPPSGRAVMLAASAPQPLRLSVQLRYPQGGGQRWGSSIYVDAGARDVVVPIDRMLPMDHQTGAAPDPSGATALLLVVDLTNARPGDANRIRVSRIGFGMR